MLIGKHGRGACEVAHKRADQFLKAQDYKAAAVWSEVANAVADMGVAPLKAPSAEQPLSDLIDDPVVQTVMARDGVGRAELDEILADATEKIERE